MSVRDLEDKMLHVCLSVSQGDAECATASEANAANMLCLLLSDCSEYTLFKNNLNRAANLYFNKNPSCKKSFEEVSKEDWCVGLPRFKEMFLKYRQFYNQKYLCA